MPNDQNIAATSSKMSAQDDNFLSSILINAPKVEGKSNSKDIQAQRSEKKLSPESNLMNVSPIHDLIAGGISGTASVFVGHPFDTIKVRMQVGDKIGTNIRSLFLGMAAPLSTAAAVNAIIFSSFGCASRIWDQYNVSNTYTTKTGEETIQSSFSSNNWKNFVCGSFAGFVQCLVICPMEHVKCRLQIQDRSINLALDTMQNRSYNPTHTSICRSPFQLSSQIISQYGFSTLFRGWHATCWREIPGFAMYFTIYDGCKDSISNIFFVSENDTASNSWMASAIAGGLSGSISWGMVYPMDIIKTRIQTSPLCNSQLQDRSIWYVGNQIIKEGGIRSIYRGFSITVLRAFPVNAIIFPVYEFTLSRITKSEF